MNTKPTLGWQCPCCSTIYSPAVMSCACQKPESKQPMDPHDSRREAQKRWEEAFREAQMRQRQPQQPPPPLKFDLDPVCEVPKFTRAPAPIQHLGKPGERRFLSPLQYGLPLPAHQYLNPGPVKAFVIHRRPTPGIADPT